jgi:NADPH:quinone reductase-like Zn-dependent oxidoreductase
VILVKAMAYERYGDDAELRLVDIPKPDCPHYSALVRVKAVGVNHIDYKVRSGLFASMMTHFPVVPGWDVAGVVETVHYSAGSAFVPGDEVIGYVWMDYIHHGGYAEYIPAPVRTLTRKPRNVTWEQAAGLPAAGLTAYQALRSITIRRGDTILIHGAAGGLGSVGAQIACHLGARVIGTAREQNHEFVRGLGVEPVRYGEDLDQQVRALAPDGVQAVADFVGKRSLGASASLLADGVGHEQMVTVADRAHAGEIGAHWIGVQSNTDNLAQLVAWVEQGHLTVQVSETLPLSDAAIAHRRLQAHHDPGKIVSTTD